MQEDTSRSDFMKIIGAWEGPPGNEDVRGDIFRSGQRSKKAFTGQEMFWKPRR
jgi:hypothetical protein